MDVDTGAVAVTVAPLTAILERDGQTGVLVVDHGRLANRPKLILADEPTASLDTTRGKKVMEMLKNIARENQTQ